MPGSRTSTRTSRRSGPGNHTSGTEASRPRSLGAGKGPARRPGGRGVTYGIVWSEPALDELADAYLTARADGRGDDFNWSVDAMEAELVRDPAAAGESRPGPYRVIYDLPASLLYRVDEAAQVVVILSVRYHL